MSKFLSGRIKELLLGVVGRTEDKTVLQTTGKVGIGTTNSLDHALYVNGSTNIDGALTASSERFRVTSAGTVGIGTTNPSAKFEVYGDGKFVSNGITQTSLTIDNIKSSGDGLSVLSLQNNGQDNSTGFLHKNGGSAQQNLGGAHAMVLANYRGGLLFGTNNGTYAYNERMRISPTGLVGIGTNNPTSILDVVGDVKVSGVSTFQDRAIFDSTNSIQIPVGVEGEKDAVGVAVTGQVRFNTTNQQFEGFGVGNNWGSLGGVKDVDGDTEIKAELSAGSDEDALFFYTGGNLSGILSTTSADFNVDVNIDSNLNVSGVSTFTGTTEVKNASFEVTNSSVSGEYLQITQNADSSLNLDKVGTGAFFIKGNNIYLQKVGTNETYAGFEADGRSFLNYDSSTKFETISIGVSVSNGTSDTATIAGPTNLILDPAAVGDNTGIVRIKGDLYVDGTEVKVDSTTINLADLKIGIATNTATNFLLDGGGIGIGSANIEKTILWNNSNSRMEFNADLYAPNFTTGDLNASTSTVSGISTNESTLFAQQVNVAGIATLGGPVTAGTSEGISGQYLRNVGTGVTWASFPTLRTTQTTNAANGQTTFNFNYNTDFLDVFINGVKLTSSEYTASNGTSVVLSTPAFINDVVELHSYNTTSTGASGSGATNLNGLTDTTISSLADDHLLQYNNSTNVWENVAVTSLPFATEAFVGLATAGLTNETFVGLSTAGLASEALVGLSTAGLASEAFVGLSTAGITAGLASEALVGLSTVGLLTATGDASNLTGLTGASAATYGDSTTVSQITVDSDGRITGITDVAISGGSGGALDKIQEGNTNAEVIDTGTDGRFTINTNGVQRLIVDPIGDVGIGTTTPTSKLEINVGTAISAFDVQGSAGQLFSVTNNLTTGSIFSVNDVSGIASIDVDADGTIQLAPYGTLEKIGIGITNPTSKLHIVGDTLVTGVVTATEFVGPATQVIVADESSDTTCFPVFTTAATGNQAPKTGANLAFNSSTGQLTATKFSGDGSLLTNLPSDTPADTDVQVTYDISNNGQSAYRFTGPGYSGADDNPDLYLVRGQRYRFINATGGHPFQIQSDTSGTAYTDGVSGSQTGTQDFNVQHNAPERLYYQCTSHPAMIGNIYIVGASDWRMTNVATSATPEIYTTRSVGIGTDSPDTQLHIKGAFSQNDANGYLKIENTQAVTNSGSNASLILRTHNATSQFMNWEDRGMRIGQRIIHNSSTGDLYFTTGNDTVRLTINASNGNFTGSSSADISDGRLKENIQDISASDAVTIVKGLQGRTFTWKEEAKMGTDTKYGFIAQEVETVIPNLVHQNMGINRVSTAATTQGYGQGEIVDDYSDAYKDDTQSEWSKSVEKTGIIPVLVEALKDAFSKIETLETQNTSLEARLSALEG